MDIILRQTMKKIWNIFISLRFLEKLSTLSYGLYYTYISTIEINVMVNQKFTNQNEYLVW